MSDAKRVVTEFFERVWNRRDESAIDELRATDAGSLGVAAGQLSAAEFKEFHALLLSSFDDFHVTVDEVIAEGEHVAIRLHLRGRRGDVTFAVPGAAFCRVQGGQIVASWNLFDVAGLLAQAGGPLMPAGKDLRGALIALR